MVDIDGLLREGIRRGASDIHLVNQMKPIFRINRELVESKETSEINENDLMEIFGVFSNYNDGVRNAFIRDRKIDLNYELDDVRSISYDIENSDEYDDLITSSIKNHDFGREI